MPSLDFIVKSSKIFIDTCTLMHAGAEKFFYSNLKPILIFYQQKAIVPKKVIDEIERLRIKSDISCKVKAEKGIRILKNYLDNQLLVIRGERNDPFADNLFQYVFTKFRTKYNLTLLTQDRNLAQDILGLKIAKSIQSNKSIKVFFLKANGDLLDWEKRQSNIKIRFNKANITKKFSVCKTPITYSERQLNVGKIPNEGDFVETHRFGKLKLENKIGEGGEGTIYSSNNGYVCKIYKNEKLTNHRENKLALMIKKPIRLPGLCWPLDVAKNTNKEFVGYIMDRAKGLPIQKAIFIRALLEKNFPLWTRKNKLKGSLFRS